MGVYYRSILTRLIQTGTTSGTIVVPNNSAITGASICFGSVNAAGGASAVSLAVMQFSSVTGYNALTTDSDKLCYLTCGVGVAAAATDTMASTQYVMNDQLYLPVPGGATLLCQVSSIATGYSAVFTVFIEQQ